MSLPLRLAQWSRAFIEALRVQALETVRATRTLLLAVGRNSLRIAEWIRTVLATVSSWLASAYYRIESSLLTTVIDIAFTLIALRYFLLIIVLGILLCMWNLWACLIYVLFILVAAVRFFRPTNEDVGEQTESHVKTRGDLVLLFRWPLRIITSVVVLYLTFGQTLVQSNGNIIFTTMKAFWTSLVTLNDTHTDTKQSMRVVSPSTPALPPAPLPTNKLNSATDIPSHVPVLINKTSSNTGDYGDKASPQPVTPTEQPIKQNYNKGHVSERIVTAEKAVLQHKDSSNKYSPLPTTTASKAISLSPASVYVVANGWYTYDLRQKYKAMFDIVNAFSDNGDGTITDMATGLTWIKNPVLKGLRHEEAVNYCDKLSYAGHQDWRLPTLIEMLSLLKSKANTKGVYLPDGFYGRSWFWTSNIRTGEDSWFVNFSIKENGRFYERVHFGPNYDVGFAWPVRNNKQDNVR